MNKLRYFIGVVFGMVGLSFVIKIDSPYLAYFATLCWYMLGYFINEIIGQKNEK